MKSRMSFFVVVLTKRQRSFFKLLSVIFTLIFFFSASIPLAEASVPAFTAGAGAGAAALAAIPAASVVLVAAVVAGGVGIGLYVYEAKTKKTPEPVPENVKEMVEKIKKNGGEPLSGYEGGRRFGNYEGKLPPGTTYREYDVNPSSNISNREGERIIIGENGRAWYTPDHYGSFKPIR